MKKISKFWPMLLSTVAISALVVPMISSCSNDPIKKVDRGNGKMFSSYSKDPALGVSFEEQLSNAMMNSSSFNAFKKQFVNQMLYNWYKDVVDNGNKQSFKDKWKQWKKDIDKAWDDQVKSVKESHKDKWKYFLQNDILDPVGGTEDSWRYDQFCSKIREEFNNQVFQNSYFAYSTADGEYNVDSSISSVNSEVLANSANWKKIDFYARANTSYSGIENGDLDTEYALIQRECFNWYTAKNHPVLSAMSLWKNAAPTAGADSIYSKSLGTIEINDKSGKTYPGFPVSTLQDSSSANAKFFELFNSDSFKNKTGKNYCLGKNGLINISKDYTQDSSTQFLLEQPTTFSSVDTEFSSAAIRLWDKACAKADSSRGTYLKDHFVWKMKASEVAAASRSDMDLLSLFLFKANDARLVNGSSWTTEGSTLVKDKYTLDLAKHYDYDGAFIDTTKDPTPTSDFHSLIFTSVNPSFDYYGSKGTEGGVRYAISSIQLTDDAGKDLPLVLIRDQFGVHLIGLDGVENEKQQDGFLLEAASDDNDNTQPMSQGRENLVWKAQMMYDKLGLKESGTDLLSKIKQAFTDNIDDIIISMAQSQVDKYGKKKSETPIFNDLMKDANERTSFYEMIQLGNKMFQLKTAAETFNNANDSIYSSNIEHVTNALLDQSIDLTKKKPTITNTDSIKNGLWTAFPYSMNEGNYKAIDLGASDSSIEKMYSSWESTQFLNWVNTDCYDLETSLKTDVWKTKYIDYSEVNKTRDSYKSKVKEISKNILPFISTTDLGKWSEKINTEYQIKDWYDDGTKKQKGAKGPVSLNNCFYKALNDFASDSKFSNSTKVKAMQEYAKELYTTSASIDSQTGYVTLTKPALQRAIASQYYSTNTITDKAQMSFYQSVSEDEYVQFLGKTYRGILYKDFLLNGFNSDEMLKYWTYLDALTYLQQNNYENLFRYLSYSVLSEGHVGYLTWTSQDNTACNPDFKDDGTYDEKFGYQENYNGKFNSDYLNPEAIATKPSSYVSNPDYFKFAKIPGSNKSFSMGYSGLVTEDSSSSAINDTIKKAMFDNSYYSNISVDAQGTQTHLGGWYKYNSFDSIIKSIETTSSSTDVKERVNQLADANKDPEFTKYVSDLANNRQKYIDGDPDMGDKKAGDYVGFETMKNRVLGTGQYAEEYKKLGWGIVNYAQYENGVIGNKLVTDLLTPAQEDASSGKFAMQIYNGDPLATTPSHLIKTDSSSFDQKARVAVVQLSGHDVLNYDNFTARFKTSDASTTKETVEEFLAMLAAQYASTSSIQVLATNEVVKKVYNGEKIKVYDRRLNDKLGQAWVANWKETN